MIRHSGARHSAIRLVPALGEAVVEVVDDGEGPWARRGAANGAGHGLAGLEARVRKAADASRRVRATTARASGCARWSR